MVKEFSRIWEKKILSFRKKKLGEFKISQNKIRVQTDKFNALQKYFTNLCLVVICFEERRKKKITKTKNYK